MDPLPHPFACAEGTTEAATVALALPPWPSFQSRVHLYGYRLGPTA